MAANIINNSSMLFDFLKSRFELNQTTDENGKPTVNSPDIKVFGFDFTTLKGKPLGNIVISLLDDGESSNSIKVYFGKDVADAVGEDKTNFYKFLKDLRQFAKTHMLGFDVRDINRSGLTAKDQKPMFEGAFGKLDGSIKTSRQPLDGLKLIIKHTTRVNPEIRGARSRRIEKIYLANNKGERFLLPFISLKAARAMAQHVNAGGTLYDDVATRICATIDETGNLRAFLRRLKKANVSDTAIQHMTEIVAKRLNEIEGKLAKMSTSRGYTKHKDELDSAELTESSYVERLLNKTKVLPEVLEYEKWIDGLSEDIDGYDDWSGRPYSPCEEYGHRYYNNDENDPEIVTCYDCDDWYKDPENAKPDNYRTLEQVLGESKISEGVPTGDGYLYSPCEYRHRFYNDEEDPTVKICLDCGETYQNEENVEPENYTSREEALNENSLNNRLPVALPQEQQPQQEDIQDDEMSEEDNAEEPGEKFDAVIANKEGGYFKKVVTAKNYKEAKKQVIAYAKSIHGKPKLLTPCEDDDHADEDQITESSESGSRLEIDLLDKLNTLWQGVAHDFYASYGDCTTEDGRDCLADIFSSFYPEDAAIWRNLSPYIKDQLLAKALPKGEVEGSNPANYRNPDSPGRIEFADDDDDDAEWELWQKHQDEETAIRQAEQARIHGDLGKYCPNTGELFDSKLTTCPHCGDVLQDA